MLEGMAFGSTSLTIIKYIFSNLKFESERVAPLLSIEHVLDVLAGWHVAGLE
jgi:hypothetical protein